MRHLAIAVLLLAGCQSVPDPPKTVYVTVEKIVPVPAELTRDCAIYQIKQQTYGEAVAAANKRLASLEECNARMKQIRKLGEPSP